MAEARICSDCGTPLTGESEASCPQCIKLNEGESELAALKASAK